MTEKEIDNLRKRFLETVEEDKERDDIIKELEDQFLKDEMIALLQSGGFEPNDSKTKKELAEMMLSDDFRENVEENFSPPEKERKKMEVKEKGDLPFIGDLISPSELLMNLKTGEYESMEEFWEELQTEIKGGFEKFKFPPQTYWENVEKEWKQRARKMEKNIEELSDTEIPSEDIEELKELWTGFIKEMNLLLGEIPIELQLRKNKVIETIQEHSEESKNIIAEDERDLKELYPLWFDMVENVRDELEEARSYMEDKEEEIYEHWEEFKDEFTMKVEAMTVEHADKIENLDERWDSLVENFEANLVEGFAEHDHLYKAFWEEMGREKPLVLQKFEKMREKIERDYSQVIEETLESIKENYTKMFSPLKEEKEKEEEIAELKERIEELENKLEKE